MKPSAFRLTLDAEGTGLERILGVLRFRQAELTFLSARRAGDVLEVALSARPRSGRALMDLESFIRRIAEVRSVERTEETYGREA